MRKVITYGTFDLFHYGHLNLLKHAKELGDYLIVGVTTEEYDINRGKLNVQQTLAERMEAVKKTGLADEIILEEYTGQKFDDIKKYHIDCFAIGSDWLGEFDYLKEYCEVVYINRTEGISSTSIRENGQMIKFGIIGKSPMADKFINESKFVSGMYIEYVIDPRKTGEIELMLKSVDAVYIISSPVERGMFVKKALEYECHVICESPISLDGKETADLYKFAEEKGVLLFEAIKIAYARTFSRLLSLVKSGEIGNVKSVDVTCTSMRNVNEEFYRRELCGGSMTDWGPFVILPIFKLLGVDYLDYRFITFLDSEKQIDAFTEISIIYRNAVATAKAGYGIKSEGDLVISGTKAYIYVPAPWWKIDYFEIRYEDAGKNRRYFYKIDGEGIRYEIAEFLKLLRTGQENYFIEKEVSIAISNIIKMFLEKKNYVII